MLLLLLLFGTEYETGSRDLYLSVGATVVHFCHEFPRCPQVLLKFCYLYIISYVTSMYQVI